MNKRLVFCLKLLVFLAILALVGWQVHKQWDVIRHEKLTIDWAFAPVALAGFIGVFITSGLVWLWMARQMGDRHRALPLMGAYTFSQMGKYVPGKIFLLAMRIERAGNVGMDPRITTLATLLENAMYMVSGALVAAATLAFHVRDNPKLLGIMVAAVVLILGACHPAVFYRLVDAGLKRFKRPPVDAAHRLGIGHLLLAVLMFLPCWFFGGVAVWASFRCFAPPMDWMEMVQLPGAFSASVIGGMAAAITPGGLGAREAILSLVLGSVVSKFSGALIVSVAFQRLFQIAAEVFLGLIGGLLTARRRNSPVAIETPSAPPNADARQA